MSSYSYKTNLRKTLMAISLLLAVGVYFTSVFAQAAPNLEINYQGKLTNASNVAVPDAGYQMEFSLYTASTSGTAIWTETRTGASEVQVQNGLFSVMLVCVAVVSGCFCPFFVSCVASAACVGCDLRQPRCSQLRKWNGGAKIQPRRW